MPVRASRPRVMYSGLAGIVSRIAWAESCPLSAESMGFEPIVEGEPRRFCRILMHAALRMRRLPVWGGFLTRGWPFAQANADDPAGHAPDDGEPRDVAREEPRAD